MKSERPYREGAAVLDRYSHHDQTLVTTPSLSAVVKLVSTYEFGVEDMCDWPSLLARHPGVPGVGDYGEFSIIIAGLAAGSVHPSFGPTVAAYVFLLAVLGPLAPRVLDPLARRLAHSARARVPGSRGRARY